MQINNSNNNNKKKYLFMHVNCPIGLLKVNFCNAPDVNLHQLKIAAAISVLHSKPAGANARQYTEQLCVKYQQAQMQWRSRYLQAQDALVHLKQQLIIYSMQQGNFFVTSRSLIYPSPYLSIVIVWFSFFRVVGGWGGGSPTI